MSRPSPAKELVALVADKAMEAVLRSLLERPQALGIRRVDYDVYVHPEHDPGVRAGAHSFLRMFSRSYSRSLVILDREGCGSAAAAGEIAAEVRQRLERSGWKERCAAVVLDPELEVWLWSPSPHVAEALGWSHEELWSWLGERGYLAAGGPKPDSPKMAVEAALRERRIPRSSAIYRRIAERVSLRDCSDESFLHFRGMMRAWFPR